MRHFLILVATIALTSLATAAPRTSAPDASTAGPFTVNSGEYKFPARVDADILADTATELWAKAYWPTDLSVKRPVLYFLHGNHATCGTGSNPRSDYDCTYTNEGTCPAGSVVVPNHEGYDYLAKHLASHGYVVVSINANRGITCGSGLDSDWGLNLARGRLVLRHIEEWTKWASAGGAPASLGIADDFFKDRVDFAQVGLMGHSRGGEGVRAALNLYREKGSKWKTRIPGLEIRGIFEIGAVDGQSGRVLDADDTAWNQLLPMCDGDVSSLEGRMPFERMILKTRETRKTPKSITMAWGTNHNFYNSEWQVSDSFGCSGHDSISGPGPISEAQQKVAVSTASAFFFGHVGEKRDESFLGNFDPSFDQPGTLTSVTRVDRDHFYTADDVYAVRVDDFDRATGMSSSGEANVAQGIQVQNDGYQSPKRAEIEWKTASVDNFLQVNWTPEGRGSDVAAYTSLDFRISRQMSHMGSKDATDFSVALVNADGTPSTTVPLSNYLHFVGPANSNAVYQTVRIPMSDFGLSRDAKIRGVRFVFDKSAAGAIYLANVRFVVNDAQAFRTSLAELLPEIEPNSTPANPVGTEENLPPNDVVNNTPVPSPTPANAPPANVNPGVPFPSAPKAPVEQATVVDVKAVAKSRQLGGGPALEISVRAKNGFPVSDALPTLVMAKSKFFVSRYAPDRNNDTLVFSLPRGVLKKLPRQGKMHVQYGHRYPTRLWQLPDYDKSRLAQ